jgi:hypothetical protein
MESWLKAVAAKKPTCLVFPLLHLAVSMNQRYLSAAGVMIEDAVTWIHVHTLLTAFVILVRLASTGAKLETGWTAPIHLCAR